MMIKRKNIIPSRFQIDSNIRIQYEIQKANWIWHQDLADIRSSQVVRFRCCWELEKFEKKLPIHVSADNRYELFLDGELISRGPDRADLQHWSFASYELELASGKHCLEALVWFFEDDIAPIAQMSSGRGGFILASEGRFASMLNTGSANWLVAIEKGWSFAANENEHFYRMVGPSLIMDGFSLHQELDFNKAVIIAPEIYNNDYGAAERGHMLYPSPLPDQLFAKRQTGLIRAVTNSENNITQADTQVPEMEMFQKLLNETQRVTIPAGQRRKVLIDLEDYYCGYVDIHLSYGADSVIKILWAESLWLPNEEGKWILKGNRDEVIGKKFVGFGDTILHDGKKNSEYRPLWWRSGRYILLDIHTGSEALSIDQMYFYETRYPLKKQGSFSCSDSEINDFIPLAERGLEMCSHETLMDCPYYEQLMYVGDTRLELLIGYVLSHDICLSKRAIELFDWSRSLTGLISERYPANQWQQSLTFSMLWVAILKDFAWWQNEPEFVKKHLVGMRGMLEIVYSLMHNGLLQQHPGWSFMDWVPEWIVGTPVDNRTQTSGIINLLWIFTLQNAAQLEHEFGDNLLAERHEKNVARITQLVLKQFWDTERGMIADDIEHKSFSEHSQCLALLTEILPQAYERQCLNNLLTNPNLHRTTVYFSFYLFEVLNKFGKNRELFEKMQFWQSLARSGFKTPIETPEPSRSDCHAWGSHPLFHLYSSIAGVHPAVVNFKRVVIAPKPYRLTWLKCEQPHHLGMIKLDLKFESGKLSGQITLPKGLSGELHWNSQITTLTDGINNLK